jgi:hypothetical protein
MRFLNVLIASGAFSALSMAQPQASAGFSPVPTLASGAAVPDGSHNSSFWVPPSGNSPFLIRWASRMEYSPGPGERSRSTY